MVLVVSTGLMENEEQELLSKEKHIGSVLMAKRKMPSKQERKRKNIYIQISWIGIILNIVREVKRDERKRESITIIRQGTRL